MSWKKASGFENNPIYDFEGMKAGTVFEGEYVGTRHIEKFDCKMHTFKDGEGKTVDMWGKGGLNWQLEKAVKKGDKVRITYLGLKKDVPIEMAGKGGKTKTVKKDVHQFDVEVWAEAA